MDAGMALGATRATDLEQMHRAALALCWDDSPWQRAQFLAVRQAFVDEWQPRGGIELSGARYELQNNVIA